MLSRANSYPIILGWLTDKFSETQRIHNVWLTDKSQRLMLSRANSYLIILGWLTDKFSETNVI